MEESKMAWNDTEESDDDKFDDKFDDDDNFDDE